MKSFSCSRPGAAARGRFSRLALAGVLAAGALTAAPVAQADSLANVRSHVHGADTALHKVAVAAAHGSVSGPLTTLVAHLRAAGSASSKLYTHAHTPAVRARAASAITKLAAQENRDATTLTPLLGQLTGANQTDVAGFLAAVTQGREQALSLATQLIGQLPAAAQGQVAGGVAQLSGAGTGQVGALAGAISPGSIACPAIDAVSQVIATVLTSVQADLTRVQSILSFLPTGAAGQFTGILNGLPTQLTALLATIKQAFNCPSTTPVTAPTGSTSGGTGGIGGIVGGTIGAVGSVVDSIISFIQSLLSSFLPGIFSGQTAAPVTVPAPVSGLIGQVSPASGFGSFIGSFIPDFGSFFGGTGGGFFGFGG